MDFVTDMSVPILPTECLISSGKGGRLKSFTLPVQSVEEPILFSQIHLARDRH